MNKIKIFVSILVLTCILCIGAAAENILSVTAPESCNAGETFEVKVQLENAEDFCGIRFLLTYDASYVHLVSAEAEEAFAGSLGIVNPTYSENEVYMSYSSATPKDSGGVVLTATFKSDESISGVCKFGLSGVKMIDENSDALNVVCKNKEVSIINDSSVRIGITSPKTVMCGENFDVTVDLGGSDSYCGIRYRLTYDERLVEVVSAVAGTAFAGNNTMINTEYANDEVFMSYPSMIPVNLSGTLMKVTFKAKEDITDSAVFGIAGLKVFDENSDAVSASYTNSVTEVMRDDVKVSCFDSANKKITVVSTKTATVKAVVAVYSENRLKDTEVVSFSLEEGENLVPFTKTVSAEDTVKIMVFSDLTKLVPLCEIYQILPDLV